MRPFGFGRFSRFGWFGIRNGPPALPEFPEARARLEIWPGDRRGKSEQKWVVNCCPICGRRHIHGGGILGEDDPRSYLTHRVKSCMPSNRQAGQPIRPIERCDGYILVDAQPERTLRILHELGASGF
jgi:hypothetical protein